MKDENSLKLNQLIDSVPLFQDLNKQERKEIIDAMIFRKFSSDEVILFEEDEENQSFFIISNGRVDVTVYTSEGKKTVLASLRRGDFFGEMAILDGEPRSASVVAAEYCELFMLYRKNFLNILHNYPKIAVRMLITMSKRIRKSNRQINTLSLMSVYGRVAEVILQLAKEQGEYRKNIILIKNRPTHQRIAEIAGTSRETVSRILSQLQKKHYISINRKEMVILDEKKLYN